VKKQANEKKELKQRRREIKMQQQAVSDASRGERTYKRTQELFSKLVIKLYGVRVFFAEREPDEGNYLLCANHTAAMDPFVLAAVLRKQQTHFMGKRELFRIPLLGGLLRSFGAFPVDRTGDVSAIRTTMELLQQGKCVGMFPQGTRCPGIPPQQAKDRLKNGAGMLCVRTGVRVLPVAMRSKGNKLRLFGQTDIIVGEPIAFEEFGVSEPSHAEYVRVTQIIFDRICQLHEQDVVEDDHHGEETK
jgi:1-acyl-sn-glycerol-3-phosphate acyltransferase